MSVVTGVGYVPVSPVPYPADSGRTQAQKQPEPAPAEPVQASEPRQSAPQSVPIVQSATDLELVFNKKLQFVVDDQSNQVIVKVIDRDTDKVIKELPPEELQRLHSNLRETIGFLFDERV